MLRQYGGTSFVCTCYWEYICVCSDLSQYNDANYGILLCVCSYVYKGKCTLAKHNKIDRFSIVYINIH